MKKKNKKSTEVTTDNLNALYKNHKNDSVNTFIIWCLVRLNNEGVTHNERFK